MSLAFSVLTPSWLLHVSDAPNGSTRTVRLQRHGAPALLTWAGEVACLPPLIDALTARPAQDPLDLARQVALEVGARNPEGAPGTALMAGWGVSPEGHRAGWRWKISNFEVADAEGAPGFQVDGTWLVPSFAQPGGKGKGKAKVSFSVQISVSEDLPEAVRSGMDRLERDLRKEPEATDLAMKLAGFVRSATGAPALLTLLRTDGALEGGILGEEGLTTVQAGVGDGVYRVR